MNLPKRTFVLFEYEDGSRAAYEVQLQDMQIDYEPPNTYWWSPASAMPPPAPPRITLRGLFFGGFAWTPGEDFNPPTAHEEVTDGTEGLSPVRRPGLPAPG